MCRSARSLTVSLVLASWGWLLPNVQARAAVTSKDVERAIADGARYLKQQQRGDGSWGDADNEAHTGTTSLATLALLTAGEPPASPTITRALDFLRNFGPGDLNSTYAVSLQTMAFAAATPERDRLKLATNVDWLVHAQIRPGDSVLWPGTWTYSALKTRSGDNSNTQYALLALHAANEAGVAVPAEVWTLSRQYWETSQRGEGGWGYKPDPRAQLTASMTCAGISSLIITGLKRFQGQEYLTGETIHDCGKGGTNINLQRAIDWMSRTFTVHENHGHGLIWRYYYLYGLERAGRMSGLRFFGAHDWYREGAEELVREQDKVQGLWRGIGPIERDDPTVTTSFALLFLAKGRSPVLINKLRHGPGNDWNNDHDDLRNLIDSVTRDREWKKLLKGQLLTWQVVDPNAATVEDLLQAPIAYITGHEAPEFGPAAIQNLRHYVEQGGFILAEACCGRKEFDEGFKKLIKEIFPEPEYDLHELLEDHAIWRAKHPLTPSAHPLWGIEQGCRTVVIYSPGDLSCFWNQAENSPGNPAVTRAIKIGENIVDYATGRELPADKLAVREVKDFKPDAPRRGALHIAKLRHAGDWNVAPLAVPSLSVSLRDRVGYDVVVSHKELEPTNPNIVHYPFIYMHGRAAFTFTEEDIAALRKHLEPGGGTLFADAACGSPSFDAAFRKAVTQILPGKKLEPIPHDNRLYADVTGYDLSEVQYTKAAGGGRDFPQLEGVKIDGNWAIIYSKYDIGCALERHQALDCKGYTYESALRIATNIVRYAILP